MGSWFLLTTHLTEEERKERLRDEERLGVRGLLASGTLRRWVNLDQATLIQAGLYQGAIRITLPSGAGSMELIVSEPDQVQRVLDWLESQQG